MSDKSVTFAYFDHEGNEVSRRTVPVIDREKIADRHRLEQMAATIAAGLLTHRHGRYYEAGGYGALAEDSTTIARAIQAEFAKGAGDE